MTYDVYKLLEEAETYLGGFMGSVSAYRRVEKLREEIRIVLQVKEEARRKKEQEK
jgi:hypothetical protein